MTNAFCELAKAFRDSQGPIDNTAAFINLFGSPESINTYNPGKVNIPPKHLPVDEKSNSNYVYNPLVRCEFQTSPTFSKTLHECNLDD